MRVLEAVGFTFECLARRAEFIRGEWVDDLRYSMLAEDRGAWVARLRARPTIVQLVEITPDDAYLWSRLRTHHSQEHFVSPMALSFRHALFPEMDEGGYMVPWLRGVLADGERVGFVMMGMVTEHHLEPYLWRLLIDRMHQRRGPGTQVLQLLVAQVREWGHPTLAACSCRCDVCSGGCSAGAEHGLLVFAGRQPRLPPSRSASEQSSPVREEGG